MTDLSFARSAFRAIMAKELHDNVRWMLLGLFGTAVALVLGITNAAQETPPSFASMLSPYPICTALVGILIGVTTIIGESRGDALGLLLHRPVGRTTIFLGKVTGGLLLYLGAVVTPLVFQIGWIASPGHVPAPFDPLMLRGPLVDILTGAVFFLAGFLGAMREARWFTTRWVVIAAAGLTFFLMAVPGFVLAIAICIGALVVCGVAAWGTFVAAGRFEQQPVVARLATGMTVGAGLAVVGVVAVGLLTSWIGNLMRKPMVWPTMTQTSLQLTRQGPVRVEYRNDSIIAVNDMLGKPIDVATFNRLDDSISTDGVRLTEPTNKAYRIAHSFRLLDYTEGRVIWYFVPRTGLVVGYDRRTARQVAWGSPTGFTTADARPTDRFEGTLQSSSEVWFNSSVPQIRDVFLVFESAVYKMNARARTVEKVFTSAPGESARSALTDDAGTLLIGTTDALYLRRLDGSQVILRHPAADVTAVVLYRIQTADANAMYLRYRSRLLRGSIDPRNWEFTKVALDGTVLDHYSIPVSPRAPVGGPGNSVEAFAVVLPPLAHVLQVVPRSLDDYGRARDHVDWFVPVLALFSLLSCAVNVIAARRYAFPVTALLLWGAFGLALGPLGVVLMVALLEWPALESCPGCGRQRVVSRDRCEHCARPFMPPQKDGTEILEFSHSSAS